MPAMNPKAANLGSRPARNTGESSNNQRVDGGFKAIEDKYGSIIDVRFQQGKCQNPECGVRGQIFRKENSYNICLACSTIQNDGIPEGIEERERRNEREMGDFRRNMSNDRYK